MKKPVRLWTSRAGEIGEDNMIRDNRHGWRPASWPKPVAGPPQLFEINLRLRLAQLRAGADAVAAAVATRFELLLRRLDRGAAA